MSGKIDIQIITERKTLYVLPGYTRGSADRVEVDVCKTCAAVVFDPIAHDTWHREQAQVASEQEAANPAEVVALIDLQLQRETVFDDPYRGRVLSAEQRQYADGFLSGRADAFSRFREISRRHVDDVAVNKAAQRIIDAQAQESAAREASGEADR
ncbi:hypothetical protein [Microbacterium arborescens]|uniref:hypothetical protein n=1 Tax=Microbacterium arborescens TaxID=33883 RepID=UPI000DF7DD4F|nr:hypothetical protein [Microbacterium arborescens]